MSRLTNKFQLIVLCGYFWWNCAVLHNITRMLTVFYQSLSSFARRLMQVPVNSASINTPLSLFPICTFVSVQKMASIETSRLRLVGLDPVIYSGEVNAAVLDTFDTLHPFMLFAEHPPSIDETRKALERMEEEKANGIAFNFGMVLKDTNILIGICGIYKLRSRAGDRIRDQIDSTDYKNPFLMGYWLHKHYEGQGYMTEATTALIDFGKRKLGVDCYLVDINPKNAKSSGLVKRLGFEFLKKTYYLNIGLRSDWGEEVPCDLYRKIM